MAVRAEESAEKLANDRYRAVFLQHESGQSRRLLDALARPDAPQRRMASGELLWQDDRPLAIVISARDRALAGQQFDVIEDCLPVERLTDVHARLPEAADRSIAEQVPEEPRERERA